MWTDSISWGTAYRLLEQGDPKSVGILASTDQEDQNKEDKGSRLLCFACTHPITSKDQRIEVNESHEHTFANPSGHIYRIGCFASAQGCMVQRDSTESFTWFTGYSWSLCACSLCGSHLGWHYRLDHNTFFGLVLDRLIEKDSL